MGEGKERNRIEFKNKVLGDYEGREMGMKKK